MRKINTLKQSLYSHQFAILYTRIMIYICSYYNINLREQRKSSISYVKRETKINLNDALDISINVLLYDTLCNSNKNISLCSLLVAFNRIYNSKYVNIPNRHYKRKSILFIGKWYFSNTI